MAVQWTKEIHEAKLFYEWLKNLTTLRYKPETEKSDYVKKYDFIIDTILGVALPECDMDQYSRTLNVDVGVFLLNDSKKFLDTKHQSLMNDEGDGTEPGTNSETHNLSNSGQLTSTPPEKQSNLTAAQALE
jgi:hypothetical protein